MSNEENRAVVTRMWDALTAMDWETLKSCLAEDVHYEDVPTEDPGARDPENVVKRLRIAFDHLSDHKHIQHHMVCENDVVFLDHTEEWTFKSGETAEHTFVSMHEIKDGLIYRWSDYWDMQKFVSQFPAWFIEDMIKASADDFTD